MAFDKTNTVEDEIMKEVALELNVPYNTVRDVVINGQAAFTKHIMESSNYDSVRWPRLGTFKLKTKHMMIKKHMMGMTKGTQKIYRKVISKRNKEEK